MYDLKPNSCMINNQTCECIWSDTQPLVVWLETQPLYDWEPNTYMIWNLTQTKYKYKESHPWMTWNHASPCNINPTCALSRRKFMLYQDLDMYDLEFNQCMTRNPQCVWFGTQSNQIMWKNTFCWHLSPIETALRRKLPPNQDSIDCDINHYKFDTAEVDAWKKTLKENGEIVLSIKPFLSYQGVICYSILCMSMSYIFHYWKEFV